MFNSLDRNFFKPSTYCSYTVPSGGGDLPKYFQVWLQYGSRRFIIVAAVAKKAIKFSINWHLHSHGCSSRNALGVGVLGGIECSVVGLPEVAVRAVRAFIAVGTKCAKLWSRRT